MITQNLTLKEAVDSGRAFRKMGSGTWFDLMRCNFKPGEYELEDIISPVWEIKVKDTFTRRDLENAIIQAGYMSRCNHTSAAVMESAMKAAEGEA